jgi:hypothetical protein
MKKNSNFTKEIEVDINNDNVGHKFNDINKGKIEMEHLILRCT